MFNSPLQQRRDEGTATTLTTSQTEGPFDLSSLGSALDTTAACSAPAETEALDLSQVDTTTLNFTTLPPSLKYLKASNVSPIQLEQLFQSCPKLTSLSIQDSPLITHLPHSGSLPLQHVELNRLPSLCSIQGLRGANDLISFNVKGCSNLNETYDLRWHPALKEIHLESTPLDASNINSCIQLVSIILKNAPRTSLSTPVAYLDLKHVHLEYQPNTHLDFNDYRSLEELVLKDCWNLYDIRNIDACTSLKKISLESLTALNVIPAIPPSVKILSVNRTGAISMQPLPTGSQLKEVSLFNLDRLELLPSFSPCKNLRYFYAHSCPQITRIDGMGAELLDTLRVKLCSKLEAVDSPIPLSELREIELRSCPRLSTIPALWMSKKLYVVDITHCFHVTRGYTRHQWGQIMENMRVAGYQSPKFHLL